MFVDLRDSAVATHLFVSKTWEPEETKLVSRLLEEGDVFVDVGANLGYFTLIASDAVGKTGRVFAFEPEPNNFSLLQKNVEVNKCANVCCERKAVSTQTSRLSCIFRASIMEITAFTRLMTTRVTIAARSARGRKWRA